MHCARSAATTRPSSRSDSDLVALLAAQCPAESWIATHRERNHSRGVAWGWISVWQNSHMVSDRHRCTQTENWDGDRARSQGPGKTNTDRTMAESLQRIIVRRALSGQHPRTAQQVIDWLEQTVAGWNQQPTPFIWNGKRRPRRERARLRRLGGSQAAISYGYSIAS